MDVAPAPPLAATRFAVVDLETNGLTPGRHRVVQVAVVTVTGDGTVVDEWSSLVRPPSGRVGRSDLHGITPAALTGQPSFAAVAPDLLRRLDGAVLTAHHARFDWAFLADELGRAGYPTTDPQRLCTLRLSRTLDPQRRLSHRLPDVAARHGLALNRHHDARSDAETTARLLPLLLADGGVHDETDLRRHLRGADTTWPDPADRAAWRAARHQLRRVPVLLRSALGRSAARRPQR